MNDKSIKHGAAVVPYAESQAGKQAGWGLPGGERTQSSERAKRVAGAMNEIMGGARTA